MAKFLGSSIKLLGITLLGATTVAQARDVFFDAKQDAQGAAQDTVESLSATRARIEARLSNHVEDLHGDLEQTVSRLKAELPANLRYLQTRNGLVVRDADTERYFFIDYRTRTIVRKTPAEALTIGMQNLPTRTSREIALVLLNDLSRSAETTADRQLPKLEANVRDLLNQLESAIAPTAAPNEDFADESVLFAEPAKATPATHVAAPVPAPTPAN
jgi:hypothetical protein